MMLRGYLSPGQGNNIAIQENKSVTPAETQQLVEPDDGYGALRSVTVESAPLQSKTVSPAEAQQIVEPDAGNYGLSKVTIAAMRFQSKSVTAKTTAQTVTSGSGYDGLSEVTVNAVNTGTATARDVKAGTTFAHADFYGNVNVASGGMADNGDWSAVLDSTNAISIPWGYHTGAGKVSVDSTNLIASNIKKSVTILGITGTYEGSGGGSSELENRLFNVTAGKATVTHTGSFYGLYKLRTLVLSGATTTESDCWSYYESGAINIELPDVTWVKGNSFRNSNVPKLTIGKAGSTTAIRLVGSAVSSTTLKDLYLPGAAVVTLQSTSGISALFGLCVHVPSDLLASYQTATNWSSLTNVTWEAIS